MAPSMQERLPELIHVHTDVVLCVMVRKNWRKIYEPIALHFDIKGLQYKLIMKHASIRLRWTMIIGMQA